MKREFMLGYEDGPSCFVRKILEKKCVALIRERFQIKAGSHDSIGLTIMKNKLHPMGPAKPGGKSCPFQPQNINGWPALVAACPRARAKQQQYQASAGNPSGSLQLPFQVETTTLPLADSGSLVTAGSSQYVAAKAPRVTHGMSSANAKEFVYAGSTTRTLHQSCLVSAYDCNDTSCMPSLAPTLGEDSNPPSSPLVGNNIHVLQPSGDNMSTLKNSLAEVTILSFAVTSSCRYLLTSHFLGVVERGTS